MKLYLAPFACSLASDIALREANLEFEPVKVDLRAKKTAAGEDYLQINPKGYVPALQMESGEILTENVAVLQYIADRKPEKKLAPQPGTAERYRLLEWLAFINSEIHKPLGAFFNPQVQEAQKQLSKDLVGRRLGYLQGVLQSRSFLMGDQFTVADCYLFTILNWTGRFGIDLGQWPAVKSYFERVGSRTAVAAAMQAEGAMLK